MASGEDLTASTIADKYQLVRLLGRGGMGAVYEARHVQTRRRCAVKLLRFHELAGDDEIIRRFFREARAVGVVESENVVSALDSGVDQNGRAYYVMEYLAGEDLSQLLKRVGLLASRAALKIAAQAARGLRSAHALHIVHRDIKPANLFVAEGRGAERVVKILDFGVAKVKMQAFDESAGAPTQTGSLLGTLQYMSPTQLTRASSVDDRADIWSLGVVLFESLTGRLPWGETDGIGNLINAILTKPIPHVREHAPWVSTEAARIVQRALARDAADRYRGANELLEQLDALLHGDVSLQSDELAPPTEQERSTPPPSLKGTHVDVTTTTLAPRSASARRLAYAAIGSAAAGAALVGAWGSRHVVSAGASMTAPARSDASGAVAVTALIRDRVIEPAAKLDSIASVSDASRPEARESKPKGGRAQPASSAQRTTTPPQPSSTGPLASRPAEDTPASPTEETPIDKLGGSAQWPNPDIVAPP